MHDVVAICFQEGSETPVSTHVLDGRDPADEVRQPVNMHALRDVLDEAVATHRQVNLVAAMKLPQDCVQEIALRAAGQMACRHVEDAHGA
jgi:hypothetical protein